MIINNIISFLKSLLFTIIFLIHTIILFLITILFRVFFLKKYIKYFPTFWNKVNIFLLKKICGVNYKIIGEEKIEKNKIYLITSKHQSTWETFFLFQYFNKYPVFILKKELLKIPIFGSFLKNIDCIAIDRKDGKNALKKIQEQSLKILNKEKRNIIIFPQGTRVPLNSNAEKYPYKGGFIEIAKINKLDILTLSLNSAKCWPKGSFIKNKGTIELIFNEVIKYEDYKDLTKKELLNIIEQSIENGQKKLNND